MTNLKRFIETTKRRAKFQAMIYAAWIVVFAVLGLVLKIAGG